MYKEGSSELKRGETALWLSEEDIFGDQKAKWD